MDKSFLSWMLNEHPAGVVVLVFLIGFVLFVLVDLVIDTIRGYRHKYGGPTFPDEFTQARNTDLNGHNCPACAHGILLPTCDNCSESFTNDTAAAAIDNRNSVVTRGVVAASKDEMDDLNAVISKEVDSVYLAGLAMLKHAEEKERKLRAALSVLIERAAVIFKSPDDLKILASVISVINDGEFIDTRNITKDFKSLQNVYANAHVMHALAEEELGDAVLTELGSDPNDVSTWPIEDFKFTDPAVSPGLILLTKPGKTITEEQLKTIREKFGFVRVRCEPYTTAQN